MPINNVSGTDNPYASTIYTAKSNEKNTLTITSYIQLLATQLQNQDMTNPMDNSEMMNQMTQMAMVQALSSMTETMTATSAMSTTTYVAGMVGKEVTVAVTTTGAGGSEILTGSKVGIIESVNLTGSSPTFRIKGDNTDHPLSHLLGIGDVTDSVDDSNSSGEDLGEDQDENQSEDVN
ncbi:MAG: flagellar hook capping protein [Lachnospiraceae bacterium]|jgi:flagellar basal-body rod modification protein FlgD|nr:flagellar hook capping protein [Lachnospiraceae bacterium]